MATRSASVPSTTSAKILPILKTLSAKKRLVSSANVDEPDVICDAGSSPSSVVEKGAEAAETAADEWGLGLEGIEEGSIGDRGGRWATADSTLASNSSFEMLDKLVKSRPSMKVVVPVYESARIFYQFSECEKVR